MEFMIQHTCCCWAEVKSSNRLKNRRIQATGLTSLQAALRQTERVYLWKHKTLWGEEEKKRHFQRIPFPPTLPQQESTCRCVSTSRACVLFKRMYCEIEEILNCILGLRCAVHLFFSSFLLVTLCFITWPQAKAFSTWEALSSTTYEVIISHVPKL